MCNHTLRTCFDLSPRDRLQISDTPVPQPSASPCPLPFPIGSMPIFFNEIESNGAWLCGHNVRLLLLLVLLHRSCRNSRNAAITISHDQRPIRPPRLRQYRVLSVHRICLPAYLSLYIRAYIRVCFLYGAE